MRILVAPDKFKGTLSAAEAANVIAAAAWSVRPDADVVLAPMADGGEGTIDALVDGSRGEVHTIACAGGDAEVEVGRLTRDRFVVELSSCARADPTSGLGALRAATFVAGEVIAECLARGAQVLVGVGGTASTDGGTGAARAIGWRFLDEDGLELPLGGGALHRLASIDGTRAAVPLPGRVLGLCDVTSPLTGPHGSARIFAPQKGTKPAQMRVLESGLEVLARRIRDDLGTDVAALRGAGAGGGAGAGLVAFFGAELAGGFDVIAGERNLARLVAAADVVVTGEGRLDAGSLAGKVTVALARMCRRAGVVCHALAGEVSLSPAETREAGFAGVEELATDAGSIDPREALRRGAARLFARLG